MEGCPEHWPRSNWWLHQGEEGGLLHTLDLGSLVHGDELVEISWRFSHRFEGWIKEIEHSCCQLEANFFGTEAAVSPLIRIISIGEFGEGASSSDGYVIGMEVCINHKSAIIDKACIIECFKCFVIHILLTEAEEYLQSEQLCCYLVITLYFPKIVNSQQGILLFVEHTQKI